ncbi:inhibitory synaptic factor 2A [Pseudochaenichthys georgianus]|uniref:inhibitory synaptic factor 2A n=1 Tax=Pseudochaenichthys georgianus TaxID=52239 RepID=UPI00146EE65A|nr:inhibitory synaptic factor 2A [Pseudochaenichthys georgianus]XP_033957201.1 inhibitory synaptic factor 2A [Pseudochaenichthys georgianus]
MVSKEDANYIVLSNSDDSDSDTGPSHSLDAQSGPESGKPQVKKRNKALQVRFRDICEAQNEFRGKRSRSISSKVTQRKYMTMPARRSIPNVTKSTGVQTSPDLNKRYKTFPFERKKGHTFKHTALVEDYKGQNNGFLSDIKTVVDDGQPIGDSSKYKGKIVVQTKALLHHTDDSSDTEDLLLRANCLDGPSRPVSSHFSEECHQGSPASKRETEYQGCGTRTKHKGLPKEDTDAGTSSKRQLAYSEFSQDKSRGTGPVAWNSLTQVESLGSPSVSCKRKKGTQLNEQQSQTLPHSAKCSVQSQGHSRTRHASASSKLQQTVGGGEGFPPRDTQAPGMRSSQQIMPLSEDKDIKVQLQAMESLINSSQETIKVLLGVIQELEKGEAQRGGLTYRTGQDTANCDTCRNSACIIYSVELDFKLQEDKIQPLIKRLYPLDSQQCPALPYSNEVFTSTPKRKSKTESKKHSRWKLWFL